MTTNVQVFGTNKSQDTKKALRFFKERGMEPQFMDLAKRRMSPRELDRFAQKFGVDKLLDREGKSYRHSGLEYMRLTDEELKERLIEDPSLMVQPLVRSENLVKVGWDEQYWREWHSNA